MTTAATNDIALETRAGRSLWSDAVRKLRREPAAIVCFGVEAALPSLDHGFIWAVLQAYGVPTAFINSVKNSCSLIYVQKVRKILLD